MRGPGNTHLWDSCRDSRGQDFTASVPAMSTNVAELVRWHFTAPDDPRNCTHAVTRTSTHAISTHTRSSTPHTNTHRKQVGEKHNHAMQYN